MKWSLLPALLLFALLGLVPVSADDKPKETPKAKLPLGRETTYVVGPLDKDGFIDYEAALNAEFGRGITPEVNANVLLIQAFGPAPEGGEGFPPAVFKWLDMPAPPREGFYFVSLGTYTRDTLALTGNQLDALFEFQSRSIQHPWSAKDSAPLAGWLKVNDAPMALVAEALKRPRYFNPLCSRRKEGEPSNLIGCLLPSVQKCRELASAFTCRAMLHVQEKKYDAAWQDILACHRLGRLTSGGATLIESLVGIAIGQIAANSTLGYLNNVKLTAKEARARIKDLQALPPLRPMADKIDLGERLMGLDALQLIRRGIADGFLDGDSFGLSEKPSPEELKLMQKVNWAPTMRTMNKWYDRLAAAMRLPDRAQREKELAKIDDDLVKQKKKAAEIGPFSKLLKEKKLNAAVGETIGDVLMAELSPAVRKVQGAHDRAEQTMRNLHVALAMAAHHADHGRYPASLDDLAPDYLPAIPGDLFSGKPLIYKPTEKGYLFYSIGQNGKDDGGRWYDDTPPGDDPNVKMPLPEKKK